jgi:hypothetical protein
MGKAQKPSDSECYTQLSGPGGIYLPGLLFNLIMLGAISHCKIQKITLGNHGKAVNELIEMNKLQITNTGKTWTSRNWIEAITL